MGASQSRSSTTSDKSLERDFKRRENEERSDKTSKGSGVLLTDSDYFGEKPFKQRSSGQKRIVDRKPSDDILSMISSSKPVRRRSWQECYMRERVKSKRRRHRRRCSDASSFAESRRPLAERFREFLTRTRLEDERETKEDKDEEISRIPFKRTSPRRKPNRRLESGRADRPRDRAFIPTQPKYDSDLEVRSDGFLTLQEHDGIDTTIDWQLRNSGCGKRESVEVRNSLIRDSAAPNRKVNNNACCSCVEYAGNSEKERKTGNTSKILDIPRTADDPRSVSRSRCRASSFESADREYVQNIRAKAEKGRSRRQRNRRRSSNHSIDLWTRINNVTRKKMLLNGGGQISTRPRQTKV